MDGLKISQSTVIVGGVLALFLVWVTLNQHLGNYLADLGLGTASATPAAPNIASAPAGGSNPLGATISGVTAPSGALNIGPLPSGAGTLY